MIFHTAKLGCEMAALPYTVRLDDSTVWLVMVHGVG